MNVNLLPINKLFFSSKNLLYRVLNPHEGHLGDWSEFHSCDHSFINGAQLEIYPTCSTWKCDDRGATNIRMFCIDGKKLESYNPDEVR